MFSLSTVWHVKQKSLCLKIWQLTLRRLKPREQAHQQLPVAGSAAQCARTVWSENAHPIWNAGSSLFRKHLALERITSYCSPRAEGWERSRSVCWPGKKRGGILSSATRLALLGIGRRHGSEENRRVNYLFTGWAAGSHSCESPVTAGCPQRQGEHLAPLPDSRAGFPTLCTPLPYISPVLPSGASLEAWSLLFSQNRSLASVSLKRAVE